MRVSDNPNEDEEAYIPAILTERTRSTARRGCDYISDRAKINMDSPRLTFAPS
jgi:hypothetical protein